MVGITSNSDRKGQQTLLCYVRAMRREDIPQAAAIDREAFFTMWPPTDFQHELRNSLAHYLVVCEGNRPAGNKILPQAPATFQGFKGIISRIAALFRRDSSSEARSPDAEIIVGFVGFWVMADEAHVTNIAVREQWRGRGIGELLLLAALEQAIRLNARLATLEVRASNTIAQNLYRKYGFNEAGMRRGYYTDNKEDAAIMTTENLTSALFQARLQKLKEAYSREKSVNLAEVMSD